MNNNNNNEDEYAKRYNSGKVDLSLLPEVASYEECKVWMDGEKKYGRDNWKRLWGTSTIKVATASLLRHTLALSSGQLFDEESGLPHAAHIRCNAAMILEYMNKENMINYKQLTPVLPQKQEDKLIVEYTTYHPFYGGGDIGYTERVRIKEEDLETFTKNKKNVRIINTDQKNNKPGLLKSPGGKL